MKHGSINHWLETIVSEHGNKTAISFLRSDRIETEMTYEQLWTDVNQFANTLKGMGIQKGDRVIVFIPKSLFSVVAHFGIQAIGAITVPLNPGYKKQEMAYLLEDADAKLIIVTPETKAIVRDIDPNTELLEIATSLPYQDINFFQSALTRIPKIDITSNDPSLIIYTSGTTGKPKGAVLTHGNLECDARNIIQIWEISADDVLCHTLPLFHIHGLCFALHTALLSGAHVRMFDQFQPETVATELSRKSGDAVCTIFMAVPTMYTKLIDSLDQQQKDFSHIRLLASGSAPLLVKEFERITNVFGSEPIEREGMSETGMNFSNPLAGLRIAGSIGLPLPGLQVRVVDPKTFSDVITGEVGEIWLKSESITKSYWRKPRETANTFEEGWFRTGDMGKIDAAGYYYLTDRIKHIIISGGENVSGKEVEMVINELDGINESVVLGKPDVRLGEKVVAAVTLKPDAFLTEVDIKAHCKTNLHDWKCPKEIVFLDLIPRNTMGKILKEEVKNFFLS